MEKRGQLFVLLYIPKKNLKAVKRSTFVGHLSENVEILMDTYGKALVALLWPALPVGAESTSASLYYWNCPWGREGSWGLTHTAK